MSSTSRSRLVAVGGALLGALALSAASCSNEPEVVLDLSEAGISGQLVAKERGCQGCHSIDGSSSSGPTWKGLYGSTVTLSDGSEVVVDEEYLIESVREPNAKRREGAGGAMGAYDQSRISDDDLNDIVAFIQELK